MENIELSLSEWINQDPYPEEIRYNEDQSAYIPIEFIKVKLDYLSPQWETRNFNHFFFPTPNGALICSASVELEISYKVDIRTEEGKQFIPPTYNTVKRTLSGTATFDVQKYYPNQNWAAIALSLSIVSAAKEIGPFFGKLLNKDLLTVPTEVLKKASAPALDKLKNTINKLNVKKTS